MTRNARSTAVVIGYDGSEGADRAINTAAELFPTAHAIVVTVVEPLVDTFAGAELDAAAWINFPEGQAEALALASQTADAGVARATEHGLHATARPKVSTPVWMEIAVVAADVRADAIIVGSRGHGAVVEALLGSVSHALARHAGKPVLIVPAELSSARGADQAG